MVWMLAIKMEMVEAAVGSFEDAVETRHARRDGGETMIVCKERSYRAKDT